MWKTLLHPKHSSLKYASARLSQVGIQAGSQPGYEAGYDAGYQAGFQAPAGSEVNSQQ